MQTNRNLLTILVFVFLATIPAHLAAQQRIVADTWGGYAMAMGTFANYAESGPTGGAFVGYRLDDNLAFGALGNLTQFDGASLAGGLARAPDMRLLNVGLGIRLEVGEAERVRLLADLGAGIASLKSDPFSQRIDPTEREFNRTYPAMLSSVRVGVNPAGRVLLYGGIRADVAWAKTEDTRALAEIYPGHAPAFRAALTVPLIAGLTVAL